MIQRSAPVITHWNYTYYGPKNIILPQILNIFLTNRSEKPAELEYLWNYYSGFMTLSSIDRRLCPLFPLFNQGQSPGS